MEGMEGMEGMEVFTSEYFFYIYWFNKNKGLNFIYIIY